MNDGTQELGKKSYLRNEAKTKRSKNRINTISNALRNKKLEGIF